MKKIILAIILIVITFGLYVNSLDGLFLIDDDAGIAQNKQIQDARAYFSGSLKLRPGVIQEILRVINWHISRTNPFTYHLTALSAHIIFVVLFFFLCRMLFKDIVLAFFAAFIFAIHPIHTEAVSWISADNYIYGSVFFIISFIFYVKAGKSVLNFLFAIFFFAVCLLTGNAVATLPFLFLFYDLFFRDKEQDSPVLRKIRFGFLIALFCLSFLYILTFFLTRSPLMRLIFRFRGMSYLVVVTKAFGYYLKLLYVPLERGLYHPFAFNSAAIQRISPLFFVSLGSIVVLVMGFFKFRKTFPALAFGIMWFFVGFAPYSNIIPICNIISERYLYLASAGFCLAVAAVFLKAWQILNRNALHRQGLRIFAVSAVTLYLSSYAVLTVKRNNDYHDIFAYWNSNINNFSDGYTVYNNLAGSYYAQGNVENAIAYCWITLMVNPNQPHVWCNLGMLYRTRQDTENAVFSYEQALTHDPEYWPAHKALAELKKIRVK